MVCPSGIHLRILLESYIAGCKTGLSNSRKSSTVMWPDVPVFSHQVRKKSKAIIFLKWDDFKYVYGTFKCCDSKF